ncbi:MAG: hypothetical protein LM563_01040 [Thermofilum sp.]|nr:hypothetical protein [Thermofilum sp.]
MGKKTVEVKLQIYEDLYAKVSRLGDVGYHVNKALERYLGSVASIAESLSRDLEDSWGE